MVFMMNKEEKYNSLNGLRAISCIGILMMHVLSNGNYKLDNMTSMIISSFTNLVFLFMIISSFAMCCGYYEKIKSNKISLEEFYKKRIKKLMPFFIFIIIIDIIYNHNVNSLIEGFANITMMFSFLPKTLNVIGVAWFLGLIFIYYMIFPFFVFLFSNKRRAWIVTITAFIMNIIGTSYFSIGRTNMFYSFLYFCIGGLIYLYKEEIIKYIKSRKIIFATAIITLIIMYYSLQMNNYIFSVMMISIFTLLICYSITTNNKLLDNKYTAYISNISLEIYLSHMLIYRIIEKINLTYIFKNEYISYVLTSVICLVGTIILAKIFNKTFNKLKGEK